MRRGVLIEIALEYVRVALIDRRGELHAGAVPGASLPAGAARAAGDLERGWQGDVADYT